jgi:hypothetical protein
VGLDVYALTAATLQEKVAQVRGCREHGLERGLKKRKYKLQSTAEVESREWQLDRQEINPFLSSAQLSRRSECFLLNFRKQGCSRIQALKRATVTKSMQVLESREYLVQKHTVLSMASADCRAQLLDKMLWNLGKAVLNFGLFPQTCNICLASSRLRR